jgi:hypothetical protein
VIVVNHNSRARARTSFGRQWLAAGAPSAAAATAGAATTTTTAASASATRTAATASTAALATSATSARTAATAATVSAASGGTARRATYHGIGSRPQAMAHRAAERVEYGRDNQSDPYDKKCIFSRSLAGLLPPRSFEGTQHDEDLTGDDAKPWFRKEPSRESSAFWVAAQGAHRSIAVENFAASIHPDKVNRGVMR